MTHTRQPPTPLPLCVLRREVASHRVAIDQATSALRVSRAASRSHDQSLSDRMSQIRRRLDAAQTYLPAAGKPAQTRVARAGLPVQSPVREETTTSVRRPAPVGSPRQTRLRLYSPPSSV